MPRILMQCLLLCGAGDGDGRGGVRDALGVGADVGGGDGACDGRVAAVASALGAVCGRAVGAVLGGRDRPGRGAALRAGAAGWLLTGAGGRAAPPRGTPPSTWRPPRSPRCRTRPSGPAGPGRLREASVGQPRSPGPGTAPAAWRTASGAAARRAARPGPPPAGAPGA